MTGTVRIKICGLCYEEDIALCVEEGADALGFVVEHPAASSRVLTRARAAELMRYVPPFVSRVAVVGGDAETILDICAATRPNAVQLHLDEPAEVVAAVNAGLANTGTSVIKAVRIPADKPPVDIESDTDAQHWESIAGRFLEAGAHAILLDSKTQDSYAATGLPFDWQIARRVAASVRPVILAGGLTPENVGRAITEVRPYAVDVLSSLEDKQHRKVRERVRAFVRAVREAEAA